MEATHGMRGGVGTGAYPYNVVPEPRTMRVWWASVPAIVPAEAGTAPHGRSIIDSGLRGQEPRLDCVDALKLG
jgi:hypothetical protein